METDASVSISRCTGLTLKWGIAIGLITAIICVGLIAGISAFLHPGFRAWQVMLAGYVIIVPLLGASLGNANCGRGFPVGFIIGYYAMSAIVLVGGFFILFC
ncbi:MAG: hypothetical protein WCV50_02330 [Patescibacteria group bacterium]|jgi:hypothetical protein